MTTPQTFREVAEEIMQSDEHVTNNEQSVKEQDISSDDSSAESKTGEEQNETFTEKTDLIGKTPEELEQIYKDWNAKYTKTRQKEREELRTHQNRIAELENKLQQVQNTAQNIQTPNMQNQAAFAKEQYDLGNMDLNQYTQYMRQVMQEDARNVAKEMIESQKRESVEREDQDYQNGMYTDVVSSDERLNEDSPNFNPLMTRTIMTDMANLLDQYISENGTAIGFRGKDIVSELIKAYDSEINKVVASRIQNQTNAAREKAIGSSRSVFQGRTALTVPVGKQTLNSILENVMHSEN